MSQKKYKSTKKRNKKSKKKRKEKKPPQYWSKEEREHKVKTIKGKLAILGIHSEYPDEIAQAYKIMDLYVETGETYEFKVPLKGAQRLLVLTLYSKKPHEPAAELPFKRGL
jgi:hypothetical protein